MAAKKATAEAGRLPETCTAGDLAVLLGMAPRNIRDWAAKGVFVKTSNGRYRTVESVQAYVKSLREQAAGRATSTGELAEEKAKLAKTQREIQDIKLAQLRGDVLTVDEVTDGWSKFALALKSAVLAVPTRARSTIPHLTAHDGETLKRICRDTLSELSKQVEGIVIGGDAQALKDGK